MRSERDVPDRTYEIARAAFRAIWESESPRFGGLEDLLDGMSSLAEDCYVNGYQEAVEDAALRVSDDDERQKIMALLL